MRTGFSSRGSKPLRSKSTTASTLNNGVHPPSISDPQLEYTEEEQGDNKPGLRDHILSSTSGSAAHEDESKETLITSIRATGVTLGLRRIPAGVYAVVQHSGCEWRTEQKYISANNDTVEWRGLIPIPSDLSTTIRLGIYASFELQPMLGNEEELRKLTVTVEELLNHRASDVPFTFKDGDVVSPCSSISVTIGRRKGKSSDPLMGAFDTHRQSSTECRGALKKATDEVETALLRYRKQGENRDLERSIEQFERALKICPTDHPCRAASQSNAAIVEIILYKVNNAGISLDIPLALYRRTLSTRPVGNLDRPSTLIHLAILHLALFEKRGDGVDATYTETLLHEAIVLNPAERQEKWAAISVLRLFARRKANPVQAGAPDHLNRMAAQSNGDEIDAVYAEALLHEAMGLSSRESQEEWVATSMHRLCGEHEAKLVQEGGQLQRDSASGFVDEETLSRRLLKRFERFGDVADLEQAISLLKALVRDGRRAASVEVLGVALLYRFQRLGDKIDLDHAVSSLREAIDLTPDGDPDRPSRLNNLGNSLYARFERFGEFNDLEQAILKLGDGVDLTPDGHPNKPVFLMNFGSSLNMRFLRFGELNDLERGNSKLQNAVDLMPNGHPHKLAALKNLGNALFARFERHGELQDLERAISTLADAVDLAPDGYPHKPWFLGNLGNSFSARFERLGELKDIERAILTLRDAVELTPDGHPDKPGHLKSLGTAFLARFKRLGEISDIERAISSLDDAVNLTPDDHQHKHDPLNNLGISLLTRFQRLGELRDLERAISTFGDAVCFTPNDHSYKPSRLQNLGNSLLARHQRLGELHDLQRAISVLDNALHLTRDGHYKTASLLNSLGTALQTRFEHLGELHDLERAMSTLGDAVHLTPDGHPEKPARVINLGNNFKTRFLRLEEPSDLERAISLYSSAASASTGPSITRFRASQLWTSCARVFKHHTLLHAYSVALSLLPQLAWIGLSLTHRYAELIEGVDVVRDAAAAALGSGYPETAVEWLEQGRSIVWGELFQLRSSYDELYASYPDHAQSLRQLSVQLEQAGATREKPLLEQTRDSAEFLEQVAHRHRTLAIERDNLLREIRRLPGFERFLLHKEFSQLRASAQSGPVVILNAAEDRCDALIVLADVERVIHVPLLHFTCEQFTRLQTSLKGLVRDPHSASTGERVGRVTLQDQASGWEPILSGLWKCVAKPILDSLAIVTPGKQPRIFWCPAGPFTFLPIHAAGYYDTQYSIPGNKVFDFVVSSYTPTLSILTPSPMADAASSSNIRFLAVRQPQDDPYQLPGVDTELKHIRAVIRNFPSTRTALVESRTGTVEEVLELMKDADWVHFACHGIQDAANPTESGLCLANNRRLKLSDMIALSRPRGGLAFLSACQTATGDKKLSDEAVHITAGMLFAGYGGVIGTMWSISDRLAPDLARDVYEQLFGTGRTPDYREAARALQDAVGRLRDSGASFKEWLPFIHVGL